MGSAIINVTIQTNIHPQLVSKAVADLDEITYTSVNAIGLTIEKSWQRGPAFINHREEPSSANHLRQTPQRSSRATYRVNHREQLLCP